MPLLNHSSVYIAINAIFLILLAYRVVQYRLKHKVVIGDGKQQELARAIACHNNAVENTPLLLLLLIVVELNAAHPWAIHAMGIGITLSRLLHAYGTSRNIGSSFGRYWGTLISWLLVPVMALYSLILIYL